MTTSHSNKIQNEIRKVMLLWYKSDEFWFKWNTKKRKKKQQKQKYINPW